jgi:hypothetical protein
MCIIEPEQAKEAKILGLKINENKTKYLIISNLQARREPRNLAIGEYDFEGVREFSYLGTNINSENEVNEDIQKGWWEVTGHTLLL